MSPIKHNFIKYSFLIFALILLIALFFILKFVFAGGITTPPINSSNTTIPSNVNSSTVPSNINPMRSSSPSITSPNRSSQDIQKLPIETDTNTETSGPAEKFPNNSIKSRP